MIAERQIMQAFRDGFNDGTNLNDFQRLVKAGGSVLRMNGNKPGVTCKALTAVAGLPSCSVESHKPSGCGCGRR